MTVLPSVRLVGHVRSAPAPPPAPPGATVQVVGSNFAGLVGRPGGGRRDAVLFFYVRGCPTCAELLPFFDTVAPFFQDSAGTLLVGKVDGLANDIAHPARPDDADAWLS